MCRGNRDAIKRVMVHGPAASRATALRIILLSQLVKARSGGCRGPKHREGEPREATGSRGIVGMKQESELNAREGDGMGTRDSEGLYEGEYRGTVRVRAGVGDMERSVHVWGRGVGHDMDTGVMKHSRQSEKSMSGIDVNGIYGCRWNDALQSPVVSLRMRRDTLPSRLTQ